MTARTRRQDALLRSLDPLPDLPVGADDAAARLQALALVHPRTAPPAPVARPRRTGRRLGALVLAGVCVAGGGVAVAGGGALDDVGSAWSSIFGGSADAPAEPRLVARGTGAGAEALQLYVPAPPGDVRCASVRAPGFSLDSCADGRQPLSLTPVPGLAGAGYRAFRTPRADYAYGRVDPAQVGRVQLSAPDRATVSTPVDPTTGYWVTSTVDTSATSPVTLSMLDRAGGVLTVQVLAYSD